MNTGSIPGYDDYKLGKDYKYSEVSNGIETLQEICCKFGGVPSFDLFRENFYKGEAEQKIIIEPKNPEEDLKLININGEEFLPHKLQSLHPDPNKGWSCASTTVIKEGITSSAYHNYRREWKWL